MARKNQVGKWGIKTKPTQSASVNTPRHCGEIDVSLFSQAIGSQASGEYFLKPSQTNSWKFNISVDH
jgi:hypothetical protein